MVLYLLGYPRDHLFVHPQTTNKQVEHWAVTCENIYDKLAFALYTRTIISAYMSSASNYKNLPKYEEKYTVLHYLKENLTEMFDDIKHDIVTPA